jgi:hypothetical protein
MPSYLVLLGELDLAQMLLRSEIALEDAAL